MKKRKLLAAAACLMLASAASCSKNEESAEKKAENVIMAETDGSMRDYVSIQFNDNGTAVFGSVTGQLAGTDTPVSIWFDGELLSAPVVSSAIIDGNCIISGDFDTTTAAELAKKIDSAPLPYEVSVKEINY